MKRYLVLVHCLTVLGLVMGFKPTIQVWQDGYKQAKPESTIGYTLEHPLHTVQGVSKQVSSRLILSEDGKQIQQVEVSVPVRSFDSGNRRRDRDMLKVTDAERYPEVTFRSSQISEQNGVLAVTGLLTFHGISKEIQFVAHKQWKGNDLIVDGGFEISLEAYNIKRPAILMMKVKDNLQVRFHMVY